MCQKNTYLATIFLYLDNYGQKVHVGKHEVATRGTGRIIDISKSMVPDTNFMANKSYTIVFWSMHMKTLTPHKLFKMSLYLHMVTTNHTITRK